MSVKCWLTLANFNPVFKHGNQESIELWKVLLNFSCAQLFMNFITFFPLWLIWSGSVTRLWKETLNDDLFW